MSHHIAKPLTGKQGVALYPTLESRWVSNGVEKRGVIVFMDPKRLDAGSSCTSKRWFVDRLKSGEHQERHLWSNQEDMMAFMNRARPNAGLVQGDSVGALLVKVTHKGGIPLKTPQYYSPRPSSLEVWMWKTAGERTTNNVAWLLVDLRLLGIKPKASFIVGYIEVLRRVAHARRQLELRKFDPFIELASQAGLTQKANELDAFRYPSKANEILDMIVEQTCDRISSKAARIKKAAYDLTDDLKRLQTHTT